MSKIFTALACNLDADILSASLPLLQEERVQAIEWTFDALNKTQNIPSWFEELLTAYGSEGRLIGHGIFFSLFSGRFSQQQQEWLDHLRLMSKKIPFDHITEHFGFMTGSDFHNGAPLAIPYSASTLAIGKDRLARIQDACGCPVGLENLAFSYSLDEVKKHGEFLERLIEPVNGFIILDLHNLYCQMHNFNISYHELINLYPLHKVREIHISGGSWERSALRAEQMVRRDTHDDAVPAEVFQLLKQTIPQCPNLKFVVMEQLGTGLKTGEQRTAFYNDFLEMERIVNLHAHDASQQYNNFMPLKMPDLGLPVVDEALYEQQAILSNILETATSCDDAMQQLNASPLAGTDWKPEDWQPYMLETAIAIAQKWI